MSKGTINLARLIIAIVFATATHATMAGWDIWTSDGPSGGPVSAIIADPSNPSTLYVGTGQGVYKSLDGGLHWLQSNQGMTNIIIMSLAIDPNNNSIVYAGTNSGIFKSVDGGGSWSLITSGLFNQRAKKIVIDSSSSSTLYMGTDGGGVFKSINGGGSWVWMPSGMTNYHVCDLLLDPSAPTTLYAGTQNGICKSMDGGSSWVPINIGLSITYVQALAIAQGTTTTVYAGTKGGGIYQSTDAGATWNATNAGLTNMNVTSLAVVATTPSLLYAATLGGGVFKSMDGGSTWSAANSGLDEPWDNVVAVDPSSPDTIYCGTYGGPYKSVNGGADWIEQNAGIRCDAIGPIVVDPSNPATIYAGSTGSGVHKSTDGGRTWMLVNSGLTDTRTNCMAIDPATATTLYVGTMSGLFKSVSGGASWTAIGDGLPLQYSIMDIAVVESTPSTLYACVQNSGLYKSIDGGATWSPTGGDSVFAFRVALDPHSPATVYIIAGNQYDNYLDVYVSTDGGSSWTETYCPGYYLTDLAVSSSIPSTVYAVDDSVGVYASSNGGSTWMARNGGLPNTDAICIAVDPSNPSQLFLYLYYDHIYQSKDAGASWSAMNNGLDFNWVHPLTVSPSVSHTVYASTETGVYEFSACPVINVTADSMPEGAIGVPYDQTIAASGGEAPYAYAIGTGSLPMGLSLNSLTGELAGSPTAGGTFSFVVTATDANTCTGWSQTITIIVCGDSGFKPIVFGSQTGCTYPGDVLSTQVLANYQWYKDGVDIQGATNREYMATENGIYSVRAIDPCGHTGTSNGFSVVLSQSPAPLLHGNLANACPASSTLLSTDNYAGYQWVYNGTPIAGATSKSCEAWVSGIYSVEVTDAGGCAGLSTPAAVTISSCVSPCVSWQWGNPKPDGNYFYAVAYGAERYVAVGMYGKTAASLDGRTWAFESSGTVNTLRGVAWNGSVFVAVGDNGAILTSGDGLSWNQQVSSTAQTLAGVAWLNDRFIAVGSQRTILTSTDGISWIVRYTDSSSQDLLSGVAWNGSKYVAVGGYAGMPGSGYYYSVTMASSDAITWTNLSFSNHPSVNPGAYWLTSIAWNGTYFYAAGWSGLVMRSPDGTNWTQINASSTVPSCQALLWNGTALVAPDNLGRGVFTSSDGSTWMPIALTPSTYLNGICLGGSPLQYVAVGRGDAVSKDLLNWNVDPVSGELVNNLYGVCGGDPAHSKPAVAVGMDLNTYGSIIMTSGDGSMWSRNSYAYDYELYAVAYSGGAYVAVGDYTSAVSMDGYNWTEVDLNGMFYGVAGNGSTFIAVGSSGKVITSANEGQTWTSSSSGTSQQLRGIAYDSANQLWIAVGGLGTIITSPDGMTWTSRNSGTTDYLYGVASGAWAYSSGVSYHLIVAVGSNGTILTSTDGANWSNRASGTTATLLGVSSVTAGFLAVGRGGVICDTADGVTWQSMSSGTVSDLNSIGVTVQQAGGAMNAFAVGRSGVIIYKQAINTTAVASALTGSVPLLVDLSSSAIGGQSPYSYDWDFGDGSPHSNAQSPSHRYQTAGNYGVTLTVRDCGGMVAMDKLVVTAGGGNVFRVPYTVTPLKMTTASHGASGTLTWDASNCASDGYHIVYGYGSGLASWSVSGGACGLGTSGTATWSNIPDPSTDSRRFIWFVVVGDNGINVEGSWGTTSSGQERGNGPSGVCGMASRASGDCGTSPQVVGH